ncbi:hypothetical protein AVEN_100921-1 [Araneus ventricosus]|uniref:Uncharacterized protein n=1 Tax=Araneus ventricosus TaxID=182803 RepID=A0A4Y2AVI8_ARAVE|nr:hypothetical protein AVEN_100921-1 [Araneus ventricosus]
MLFEVFSKSLEGHEGQLLTYWLRGWRVPDSKPDSTEKPPRIGSVVRKIIRMTKHCPDGVAEDTLFSSAVGIASALLARSRAGHSSALHSIPFAPRLFFQPFKSKNEARHSRRLQSLFRDKVQSCRILPPLPLPLRGRFRVSFLPSTQGLSVGRSVNVPLPSNRGPKWESAHEVLDFEFV